MGHRVSTTALLLAAVGCGSMGAPDDTDDTDPGGTPTVAPPEPSIDLVEPFFGTNGGGELVTITGTRFPDDPVVTIGGAEATILSATPNQIQVTTAPTDKTDWVPVRITSGDEEIKQNRAYQMWSDGRGLTGLWGAVYRLDYQGTYWAPAGGGPGPYTPPPIGRASLMFLEPAELRYTDVWAPGDDLCVSEYDSGLTATVLNTEMEQMVLRSGDGIEIAMGKSTTDLYGFDDPNVEGLFLSAGKTFSLLEDAPTSAWPAFGIDNVVTMPAKPQLIAPELDGFTFDTTGPQVDLEWLPELGSTWIVANLYMTTNYGGTITEQVTCRIVDDGTFSVPAEVWTTWAPGEFVIVQIGRVWEPDRELPHNRSNSQLMGIYWIYGALQAL